MPPSAIRTPISCVRCWIERAITAYRPTAASAQKRGLKPVSPQPFLECPGIIDRQIRIEGFHHRAKPLEPRGGPDTAPRNHVHLPLRLERVRQVNQRIMLERRPGILQDVRYDPDRRHPLSRNSVSENPNLLPDRIAVRRIFPQKALVHQRYRRPHNPIRCGKRSSAPRLNSHHPQVIRPRDDRAYHGSVVRIRQAFFEFKRDRRKPAQREPGNDGRGVHSGKSIQPLLQCAMKRDLLLAVRIFRLRRTDMHREYGRRVHARLRAIRPRKAENYAAIYFAFSDATSVCASLSACAYSGFRTRW